MRSAHVALILAVLAAMMTVRPAIAQRSVSELSIPIANWVFVPTLYDGTVETFLALRTDAPEGNNITSMWFIKQADNTWSSWGWTEQDRSKTTGYVKTALQISDSDNSKWPVAPAAVDPDDLPQIRWCEGSLSVIHLQRQSLRRPTPTRFWTSWLP